MAGAEVHSLAALATLIEAGGARVRPVQHDELVLGRVPLHVVQWTTIRGGHQGGLTEISFGKPKENLLHFPLCKQTQTINFKQIRSY